MGTVVISLDRIICHDTTEAGHDEVYYGPPGITRTDAQGRTAADGMLASGPRQGQLGNADGPNGDPTPPGTATTIRTGPGTTRP